jgi:hypothetical protein
MYSPVGDLREADFAIYLDYGIDCCFGNQGELVINERGIIFRSRWRFPLGTQLAIRICAHAEGLQECPVCDEVTGMVVSCERVNDRDRNFESTLLFLDISEPAQHGLCRVADQLDRNGIRPEAD